MKMPEEKANTSMMFDEFEKHLTAYDWESAIQIGEELSNLLEAGEAHLNPTEEFYLYHNLGAAYIGRVKGDVIKRDENGKVVYHSRNHLEKALEIGEKHAFETDRTRELLERRSPDASEAYLTVLEMATPVPPPEKEGQ